MGTESSSVWVAFPLLHVLSSASLLSISLVPPLVSGNDLRILSYPGSPFLCIFKADLSRCASLGFLASLSFTFVYVFLHTAPPLHAAIHLLVSATYSLSFFLSLSSPLSLPPPLFFVFSTLYSLSLAPLSCLSLVPLPHCCFSLCFNPVRMRGTCLRRCVPALEPVLLGAAVPYLSFPDDRSLLERKSGNLPRITPLHSHRTPIPYVNPFSCFRMATPVVLCFWGLCVHRSGA